VCHSRASAQIVQRMEMGLIRRIQSGKKLGQELATVEPLQLARRSQTGSLAQCVNVGGGSCPRCQHCRSPYTSLRAVKRALVMITRVLTTKTATTELAIHAACASRATSRTANFATTSLRSLYRPYTTPRENARGVGGQTNETMGSTIAVVGLGRDNRKGASRKPHWLPRSAQASGASTLPVRRDWCCRKEFASTIGSNAMA
jgi:hypothetical protein